MNTLQGFLDVVTTNRAELNPTAELPETEETGEPAGTDISSDMLS